MAPRSDGTLINRAVPAIRELAQISQWVVWKEEKRGPGKKAKIPYCVGGVSKASSTDPSTWDTFDAAWTSVFVDGCGDGIGIVVTPETGIIGVDCDNCIDLEGNIDGEVWGWIHRFGSYTEISPSGKGIRIFCRGSLTRNGYNPIDSQWEIYRSERYLTVTGNHVDGTPLEINEAQEAIDRLVAVIAPKAKDATAGTKPNGHDRQPLDLDAMRKALTGETPNAWHNAMLMAVAHLVAKGYEDWFILDWALHYRWRGYDDRQTRREIEQMIDGARAKGFAPGQASGAVQQQPPELVLFDDCNLNTNIFWTIEDLLPRCGMLLIYGRGGCGKTYLGTSVAVGVGTGEWFGHETDHGAVLICAFERPDDAEDRLASLRDLHGYHDQPIALLKLAGVPLDERCAQQILDAARRLAEMTGLPVRAIEIDTARAALGPNKEDDEGLGRLRMIGERLHAETDATIVWIAHEGKADSMGPRGHLVLADACTVWWHVEERESGERVVHVPKANRGRANVPLFSFKLVPFEAGRDRKDKPIELCEVQLTNLEEAMGSPARKSFGPQQESTDKRKPGKRQQLMIRALKKLLRRHPDGVDLHLLRSHFLDELNDEREKDGKGRLDPEQGRSAVHQTLESLKNRGFIEGSDDALRLCE